MIVLNTKNLIIRSLMLDDDKELLDYYVRNKEHFERFEPKRDLQFYTEEVQKNILTEKELLALTLLINYLKDLQILTEKIIPNWLTIRVGLRIICLFVGNNNPKGLLIPHKTTRPAGQGVKGGLYL